MEITSLLLSLIVPAVGVLALNAIFGLVASDMARKRGLKPVPAFFAAFFGSFVALFLIALTPARQAAEEKK